MNQEKSFENLTIGNKDYLVELTELNQADLKFYPENPRVYSVLNLTSGAPTQEDIEEYMCNLESVKQLKVSIESNGGLIDPLIVRSGDFTVLEGNSRLAAYRILCTKDPVKWGKVRCKLLPAAIDESAIFALLGQYHIVGRKDWDPFEQAHYLYRRHKNTKLPIEYMAKELGISKQKAENMVDVIEFMISKDDLNKRHWSYYEEYMKNSSLKKYRETNPDLDDTIARSVKCEQIKEAKDMRRLGEIAKVGDKQSKRIMMEISLGKIDIYNGYTKLQESGKLEDVIKRLKTFRMSINDDTFEKQIFASQDTVQQAQYEISHIIKRLIGIQRKFDK